MRSVVKFARGETKRALKNGGGQKKKKKLEKQRGCRARGLDRPERKPIAAGTPDQGGARERETGTYKRSNRN